MSYYIHTIYTIIYICMPLKACSTGNTVYRYRFLFKNSRSKSNLSYSDQKWPFRNAEITTVRAFRKQGVYTDFFRRTPVRPYIVSYMKKPLIPYGSSGAVYPTTSSQSNRKNNISTPFFLSSCAHRWLRYIERPIELTDQLDFWRIVNWASYGGCRPSE